LNIGMFIRGDKAETTAAKLVEAVVAEMVA
jgi:hypothetical protein